MATRRDTVTVAAALLLLAGVAGCDSANAAGTPGPASTARSVTDTAPVTLLTTTHVVVNGVTKDPAAFDIGWVDDATGHYYLSDDSNNGVDEFDARTGRFIGLIGAGAFHTTSPTACAAEGASSPYDCKGPDGIVTDKQHRIWAADWGGASPASSIKVMAPTPGNTVIKSIPLGGKFRSDELSYDPRDQMILIANPDYQDAFVSWVNTRTLTVAGRYTFAKPADPNAWGGLEQSVWDPATGLFYLSVPGVADNSGKVIIPGKIDVFAPRPGALVAAIPTPNCVNGPVGLALTSNHRLIGGCDNGAVVADVTGHVRGMISHVGGADEIWFNPGDGNLYAPHPAAPGSTTYVLGVATVHDSRFLGDLPAGTLAHSVAADACDNHIFVPVLGRGIDVFTSRAHSRRGAHCADTE